MRASRKCYKLRTSIGIGYALDSVGIRLLNLFKLMEFITIHLSGLKINDVFVICVTLTYLAYAWLSAIKLWLGIHSDITNVNFSNDVSKE